MLSLTNKQKEFWNNANCRWNIKSGATRSGKTFLDYYLIPKRIRSVHGQDGQNVILGNTKATIQRNIIEPLQNIWGNELVSDIRSDNTAFLFGEKVHCLGADKINQVNRLRGSSIKYCYGDEVVTWHEEVFQMLKSRLDKPYSKFDGTCNPDAPNHWFKIFMDKADIDIFKQDYTLYDNPFLSREVVKSLENEYRGTVYFDRNILGKWVRAEGIVFPNFANNSEKYIISHKSIPDFFKWVKMGYDLGGNKSAYGLCAAAQDFDGVIYILRAVKIQASDIRLEDVAENAKHFINDVEKDFGVVIQKCFVDDSYYTTINTLNDWRYIFDNAAAVKNSMPLADRPLQLSRLMNLNRFYLVENECNPLIEELQNAVFDDKSEKAIILDDGSMQIDTMDAMWYSLADDWLYLL